MRTVPDADSIADAALCDYSAFPRRTTGCAALVASCGWSITAS
jgi:hypothetical protein